MPGIKYNNDNTARSVKLYRDPCKNMCYHTVTGHARWILRAVTTACDGATATVSLLWRETCASGLLVVLVVLVEQPANLVHVQVVGYDTIFLFYDTHLL